MERKYTKTTNLHFRDTIYLGRENRSLLKHLDITNSLYLFTHRYYSDSSKSPSSKISDKENKTEMLDKKNIKKDIFSKGFPLVFRDMSKIREQNYYPIIKQGSKYVHFYSLKDVPGIYMITNNITKKYYIGMSTNLYKRFNNYLDVKRLTLNGSSRINKALLKYGYENFSITILELLNTADNNKGSIYGKNSLVSGLKGKRNITNALRNREDFFIKVFEPQYNIKRYLATREMDFFKNKYKMEKEIPLKVRTLLNKCLDPNNLEHNLICFRFSNLKREYIIWAATPKEFYVALSSGWYEGQIDKPYGFKVKTMKKTYWVFKNYLEYIMDYSGFIEKNVLAEFYTEKGQGINYVKDCLKRKRKALRAALKKEKGKKD